MNKVAYELGRKFAAEKIAISLNKIFNALYGELSRVQWGTDTAEYLNKFRRNAVVNAFKENTFPATRYSHLVPSDKKELHEIISNIRKKVLPFRKELKV